MIYEIILIGIGVFIGASLHEVVNTFINLIGELIKKGFRILRH